MDPRILLEVTALPQHAAVLAMLVLAVVLLRLGFNDVTYRAFALLLIFRALVMLAATWHGILTVSKPEAMGGLGDPHWAQVWALVQPYVVIAMPFLIIWFASVYPRRRGFFGTHRAGPFVLVGVTLLLELIYVADHSSFWSTEPGRLTDGTAIWRFTNYIPDGPLSTMLGLMYLGLALLSFLFTVDYVRLPPGPRKSGILVVAFGFLLNALFDGSIALFTLISSSQATTSLNLILLLMGWIPAIASLVLLVVHDVRESDLEVHRHIRRGVWVAVLPVLSGAFAVYNPLEPLAFMKLILTGFWRLWLPALVTYALVRHQLFDIDVKLKFALKQSTLAGIALVAFLTLSEVLETLITNSELLSARMPERTADLVGLGVAVGLTYALKPVQNLAQGFTDKAMPGVANTEDYLFRKRLEVYRATLEGAMEDGDLTDREKLLMEGLRLRLGLNDTLTAPLEAEVRAAFGTRTIGRRRGAA